MGFFLSRRESGKNRSAELMRGWDTQWQKERIDVLEYATESMGAAGSG